jgi:hypothetical protein
MTIQVFGISGLGFEVLDSRSWISGLKLQIKAMTGTPLAREGLYLWGGLYFQEGLAVPLPISGQSAK